MAIWARWRPAGPGDGRDNSFDLLRILAALCVIAFHCGPLQGRAPWAFGDLNLGALGVGTFFVVSGFLVTGSLRRSTSLWAYVAARLVRIGPGLLVSAVVTALLIGAWATTLPLDDYFGDQGVYLYMLRSTLLVPASSILPGVFEHNALPYAVNGSLWTLRIEIIFYVALALLSLSRLLKPAVVAGMVVVLAAATLATKLIGPAFLPAPSAHLALILAEYAFLFFAGALLALVRAPSLKWTLASGLLLLTPAWVLGLPLLVVQIGRARTIRLPEDISYGLYIYAFPLQQLLASWGHLSFWTSVAATLPFAVASWFLVERPALALRRRAGPAPVPTGLGGAPARMA